MKIYILRNFAALAVTALFALANPTITPAYADCASPTGVEGEQVYNLTYKTMQFCDGSNWYSMKAAASGALPIACNPGETAQWNGTVWVCASGGATSTDTGLLSLQLAATRITVSNGWTDPLTAETDIDTAQNMGVTYVSSGGGYYHNPGAYNEVALVSGMLTNAGTMSGWTPANLVNNILPSEYGFYHPASGAEVKVDLGNGNAKEIRKVRFAMGGTQQGGDWSILYSDDGTNYTSTGETLTIPVNTGGTYASPVWHEKAISAYGVHRYWKLALSNSVTGDGGYQEMELFESLAPANMTVISKNAVSATTAPSTGRLQVQINDISTTAVANTDFKGYISRDNGTTWTQGTLALVQTLSDGAEVYGFDNLNLTSQPSGTAMRWKFTTHNAKEIQLHGLVLQWQ